MNFIVVLVTKEQGEPDFERCLMLNGIGYRVESREAADAMKVALDKWLEQEVGPNDPITVTAEVKEVQE